MRRALRSRTNRRSQGSLLRRQRARESLIAVSRLFIVTRSWWFLSCRRVRSVVVAHERLNRPRWFAVSGVSNTVAPASAPKAVAVEICGRQGARAMKPAGPRRHGLHNVYRQTRSWRRSFVFGGFETCEAETTDASEPERDTLCRRRPGPFEADVAQRSLKCEREAEGRAATVRTLAFRHRALCDVSGSGMCLERGETPVQHNALTA